MNKTRVTVLLLCLALLVLYVVLDPGRFLSLAYLQSQLDSLRQFTADNFLLAASVYFLAYVAIAALSIPGAAVATLAGGAIFGLGWGLLLASFASTIGASLAFLVSRWLLRDWVQSRFGRHLQTVNRGIARDGSFYLFSIRMVPLFPFFLVNLVMGLTPIRLLPFFLVSQVGMLPGTAVYINAGAELAQLESLSGLLSAPLLFSFALLALFPWLAKGLLSLLQRRKPLRGYTKPRRFDANLVVIGAGSAGLVSSLIAAGARAKVVLVEKHKMGGDCLNTGCVPSKSLIRSASIAKCLQQAADYGLEEVGGRVNFARVMERVQEVIRRIEPHDSVERYTSLGVECLSGEARITSPWSVEVGGRSITTRAIIVATGARPLIPPIPGLDRLDYLHSDNVWELRELPPRLLVLGAGPVGCELAQSFARLGSSVTLVDRSPAIMSREDDDVAALVQQHFMADGIRLLLDHEVLEFRSSGGEHSMLAVHQGQQVQVDFDRVLVALGRKPNVEGFGLEELAVNLAPEGTIEVNARLQTSCPTIYACGDVAGPYQFTHMASFQAWYATLNALLGGLKRFSASYAVVPFATFSDPEVARVGLNEREARARQIDYELTRYDIAHLDRAIAEGEAHGFVKVLTVPGSDRILGATIVGSQAGELIGEFVLAMTHGLGLKKIAATTHIYPTRLEANRFAANAWRSARIPQRVLPWAGRYFRWRRG